MLEPRPLFDPFELETTARARRRRVRPRRRSSRSSRAPPTPSCSSSPPTLEGDGPALFIVEAGRRRRSPSSPSPRWACAPPPPAACCSTAVQVPAGALLGDGDPEVYAECVRLGRIAWCALAVGTAQAVLDYVIPYVNERKAFGEPITNRQAVAFAVVRHRDRDRGHAPRDLPRRRAAPTRARTSPARPRIARQLCATKGMQIGSDGVQLLGGHGYVKEHPVERWYRDLRAAGVMEGALLV